MSKQSKRRRDAKRAAQAKAQRRRTTTSGRVTRPSAGLSDFFTASDTVDVSVIRPASDREYADGENIPLDDREVLARRGGVRISDATACAEEYEEAIKRGDYPADSRVTVMDSSWQMG